MKILFSCLPIQKVIQLRKKHFFVMFLLFVIVYAVLANNGGWSSEEIKSKTPQDIINDPINARKQWGSLSYQQKEEVYKDSGGIKEFSDKFAEEKGLKSLTLTAGSPSYDGANLINGDTEIPVSALANAEVTSKEGGGFHIKYPDGSDLSKISFNGGTGGISFEGKNLKFAQGSLSKGAVTIYGQNHIKINPDSEFTTDNVQFTTKSAGSDLYYGAIKKQNGIEIDKNKGAMRIAGDDITAEFIEGHNFKDLYLNGRITLVDGSYNIEFDGNGNYYSNIPIGSHKSNLFILDENAPDKLLILDSEAEIALAYAGCGTQLITGAAIVDVTGRVSESVCKGPIVQTGSNLRSIPFFLKYEANLFLSKEQAEEVKEAFVSKYGRGPDMSDKDDVNELGRLINHQVTELKLEVKTLKETSASKGKIKEVIEDFFERANVKPTKTEQSKLEDFYEKSSGSINKGTIVEYQVNGNDGLIIIKKPDGSSEDVPLSGRLVKAIAQNYYDNNINDVGGQSKDLLESYFGGITVAMR